ncbi:alpha/beta fold hydrolase [Maritalea sp.]|jgi:pimeloyl-ACP methyl ester carboxylesterase|uniref:alpha/beta fold hydrolase n=1 Tax=Maritalea sp. TaxID=2003361 RepID=UPI0039E26090
MMDQPLAHTNVATNWRDLAQPLPKSSVYRSSAARAEFQAYYQKTLDLLTGDVETSTYPTSFGTTHVSCMGNRQGKPMLILPGMSIAGPMMLDFFAYLAKDHWLIAPDLIGQPGRSADVPFSINNNAYGKWIIELMDQMSIQKTNIAAASFGGSIGLEMLKLAPERVNRHALIVSAGVTPKLPYLKIYAKLLFSWLAYRYFPNKSLLPVIARPLSRHLTPDNLDYLDIIIRQTAFWRHRPAGPFFKKDMPQDMEPVLIVFARNDILFPYAPTRAHAEHILNIGHEFVLEESAHMPGDKEMAPIHKEIEAYFKP